MKRIGMVLGIKVGLAVFCAMVALSATAFAEDAKPAGLKADDVKAALGFSIYLQGGYTVNANASSDASGDTSSENNLRVFDHKANSFTLDLAQIVFSKDPAIGAIGYKLKLSDGETAKFIHARGMGVAGIPGAATDTDPFDVTEAYVSYTAPIGKGLRFDLGKMVTFFGAEVIEAIDNPNYSRSFLFNYAIPFTHTGLKMSYAFTDALNASFHIVNGWDNAEDNNTGKCVGVSVNYAPAEIFSGYVNFMTGPEQANNNRDNRTLIDIVATIKPIKPLSIILNYDDGREDNTDGALQPSGITSNTKWSGFAGIVKYDLSDAYSIAVRGEIFDDKDGFRTGTVQKLKEMTLTFEARLTGGLILRPEYRHDSSDKESFENGTKKSQDTIALGALYRW